MTWEWLGPAAVTAIVAIVGNYLTWRAGRDTREHAEHVAEATANATLKREREARRAVVYLDILATVIRITTNFLHRTAPPIVPGKLSEFPDPDELATLAAKAGLHGSDSMRDHVATWANRLQELTDVYAPPGRDAPPSQLSPEESRALDQAREALTQASGRIANQMNSELAALPYFPDAKAIAE